MSPNGDEKLARLEEALGFAERENERTREALDEVLRQLASVDRRLAALERRLDAVEQGSTEPEIDEE